ncbi:MAG: hypothetical protein JJ971_15420 [Balneolaceae bacterium]|nr:hypothetical protein [Balneolaceae bacterium]MBO6547790.1 hypothetical protein [Balneolaceae bacterium]MBO6648301.1 hypothetical protein [Balneolaceae bacterium]
MKTTVLTILFLSIIGSTQYHKDTRITTMDFVQILNDNREEVDYYYENNWKLLRDKAIKKGYIESYQLLETSYSEDAPFHLILITTYPNKERYDKREENFAVLIEEKGPRRLLNNKQPSEFRKIVFSKDKVVHKY